MTPEHCIVVSGASEGRPTRVAKMRGFSLLEIAIVLALILVASSISFITLQPTFAAARIDGAYNLTLMTMRRARQRAVDERKTYIVTILAPRTLQVWRQDGAVAPNPLPPAVLLNTYTLPQDISYKNEPGIPTTPAGTPDGFGIGAFAVDFSVDYGGGFNSIYFQPNGGGYDQLGRVNNGVVYMSRTGVLDTSRAISLFGLTGQLHGWRLQRNAAAGTVGWNPQ